MIILSGGRRTGKTTELIRQCKKLNDEQGINDTIIITRDNKTAEMIYALARELGCGDIPYPIPIDTLMRNRPTHYRKVLINDLDAVMQTLIAPLEVQR